MNFLSHFYFDRNCTDAYHVLGAVMPDLLRNADKNVRIKPEHLAKQKDPDIKSIISGWKKHLDIDRHFHACAFFYEHAHELKLRLTPAVTGLPVKPFFLGHIALELILDNLLLTRHIIFADDFYAHLQNAQAPAIINFLQINNVDPQKFLNFYTHFINDKYLNTYIKTESIVQALEGICRRIWKTSFSSNQKNMMNIVVVNYIGLLSNNFMQIFEDMDAHLPQCS